MDDAPTWKGRLIALTAGLVITVLVAEGALRVLMPEWRDFYSLRFMHRIMVPEFGKVFIAKPGFDGYFAQNNGDFRVHISINDAGLRNPESIEAAEGRIWVLGDSMAFGWGVEQNEMYASVISSKLGVPTYNVASPGTDVCGYQALLARMPQSVRPAAVIVGLVLENDMLEYDCRADAEEDIVLFLQEREDPGVTGIKILLTRNSALYNFLAISLKRVDLIRNALTAIGIINTEHVYKRFFTEETIDMVAASTGEELTRLKAMLPQGTPFGVLVAPGRFEIRDGDPPYRKMRLKIGEELAQRGIGVIDPYQGFMAAGFQSTHFTHDGHWTPLGHQIAAAAAAKWLNSHLGEK